jgi:hypothetical protein
MTDLAGAAASFAEATRLYYAGNLHSARDVAEQLLLSLATSSAERMGTPMTDPSNRSRFTDATREGCQRQHHQLFGNVLLLLCSVYTAVREYSEAERLLAVCEGYWKEHLHNNDTGIVKTSTPCRDLDEGLAGVAYNRAVLQLEQLRCPTAASDEDRHTMITDPAHMPTVPPPFSLLDIEKEEEQRRRCVAADILTRHLDDARDRLNHAVGPLRCLLADVHHSRGVCRYYCRDYVGALEAWQQSIGIRVHLHHHLTRRQAKAAVADDDSGGSAVEELKLALTMEHVAHVYQLIDGRMVDALKVYDVVAATRERLLGPAHPLCARTLLGKAVLASTLGRTTVARALLDRCRALCTEGGAAFDAKLAEDVRRWHGFVCFPS